MHEDKRMREVTDPHVEKDCGNINWDQRSKTAYWLKYVESVINHKESKPIKHNEPWVNDTHEAPLTVIRSDKYLCIYARRARTRARTVRA